MAATGEALADAEGTIEELDAAGAVVRLVHPLDLTEEEREAWRGHFGRMEIVPPFAQIDRAVERCDAGHGNRKRIAAVHDKEVVAGIFMARAKKRGWGLGMVPVGSEMILNYYKEFPAAGIEAVAWRPRVYG